ncbi:uncharacterized protein LOC120201083 [Hibiscus syriacus]|uniref:uncharacterized protein LOC120201083 n=1 Tax=Hibiscus syriacus TaxID=106335 RepID=UPI001923B0FD|nr:uncharacterized protein LOC120201083 [Hibiscus syriacus]
MTRILINLDIIPLLLAGIISILYRRFFDDLRPYGIVQFVPCIAIPLMAILLLPMYTHSAYWLWKQHKSTIAGFYLLAKIEEAMDKVINKWTHHVVSGHIRKHLCAAMVPVFLTLMLAKRTIETNRISLVRTWKVSWTEVNENGCNMESREYAYTSVQSEDSHSR